MNIVGLITEYNPFHNGHRYHIEEAKRITGADTVIVIMSGNFVQRGTPAIIDKYKRTEMALHCGADLVIELPVCYATASAESFALGAVSILDRLGIVDHLVFGSECGDLSLLEGIADLLVNEPESFQTRLQEYLRAGLTYPSARTKALIDTCTDSPAESEQFSSSNLIQLEELLKSPNNILGIEYLKALSLLGSRIKPHAIQRIQSDYHEKHMTGTISSATSIRRQLETKNASLQAISNCMPEAASLIFQEEYKKTCPIKPEHLNLLIKNVLLQADINDLMQYQDVSEDLARRICNQSTIPCSYEELILKIKSKQYTQTRIQRSLLHILLQITTKDMKDYRAKGITPYARILGFRKSKAACLRRVKEYERIELITKLASASPDILSHSMLKTDIAASRLYHHIVYETYRTILPDEFTQNLVILP